MLVTILLRVKDLQGLTALSPVSSRRYLTKFTQLGLLDSKGVIGIEGINQRRIHERNQMSALWDSFYH